MKTEVKTYIKISDRIRKDLERHGYAETNKYMYRTFDLVDRQEIRRIERTKLDTTAAIDGWITVETIGYAE